MLWQILWRQLGVSGILKLLGWIILGEKMMIDNNCNMKNFQNIETRQKEMDLGTL